MKSRAFLVGINRYPDSPLRGCVNDVMDMADLLTRNYGFSKADVTILTDGRATTANVLDGLRAFVRGLEPGDRALFHYSGHGAQVPDKVNAWEADHLDEVICPIDFDWTPKRMITDKQFHDVFAGIPEGVRFAWVSDSCHSGDLSRDLGGGPSVPYSAKCLLPPCLAWHHEALGEVRRARMTLPSPAEVAGAAGSLVAGLPSPQQVAGVVAAAATGVQVAANAVAQTAIGVAGVAGGVAGAAGAVAAAAGAVANAARETEKGAVVVLPEPVLLVSGCAPHQTSADATFAGRANGALTYFLLKSVKAHPTTPMRTLIVALRTALAASGYSQQPQVEGSAALIDRPFLG